jgi:hypothetical protein
MDKGDEGGRTATSFNAHLFDQMRDMHRGWLEKLQEIRQLESEYGTRLMSATGRSEAVLVCSEWMAKRMEIIAHEQKTFANAWLRLSVDVMASASTVSAKISERDE